MLTKGLMPSEFPIKANYENNSPFHNITVTGKQVTAGIICCNIRNVTTLSTCLQHKEQYQYIFNIKTATLLEITRNYKQESWAYMYCEKQLNIALCHHMDLYNYYD